MIAKKQVLLTGIGIVWALSVTGCAGTQDSEADAVTPVETLAFGADEELVTIRCTDSTVFELWKIQGGGAGIETSEAAFSDLAVGSGLEAEGYFDGEEFAAKKSSSRSINNAVRHKSPPCAADNPQPHGGSFYLLLRPYQISNISSP